MSIEPQVAAVKPRIESPETGGSVPLQDVVQQYVSEGKMGCVAVCGASGSGRTTALRHVAAHLPGDAPVRFLDQPTREEVTAHAGRSDQLSLYTNSKPFDFEHLATYQISSWTRDDLIEYLLARHKEVCRDVMDRLDQLKRRNLLNGNPGLWSMVLDTMARDESAVDVYGIILAYLREQLSGAGMMDLAGLYGYTSILDGRGLRSVHEPLDPKPCSKPEQLPGHLFQTLRRALPDSSLPGRLKHQGVRTLLASDFILGRLRAEQPKFLHPDLPFSVVDLLSESARKSEELTQQLRALSFGSEVGPQAMSASILQAAHGDWVPQENAPFNISGGYFENVRWDGRRFHMGQMGRADLRRAGFKDARLDCCELRGADISHACFDGCVLQNSYASKANFRRCSLRNASVENCYFFGSNFSRACLSSGRFLGCDFDEADFTDADLSFADLESSQLRGAQLRGANLTDANLRDVSLTSVCLCETECTGAMFVGADLSHADLGEIQIPDADFRGAKLVGAELTGSVMPRACFRDAVLRETGLGEIQWENADLRGADLRGATFHMGSTRSGKVDSYIACEGSKTGFYTEEVEEQHFKAAEEIRKANLKGADLRGARLADVDFYLVDLRDAKLDEKALPHLRRCGAILKHRV